ncbi:uncharacterized protein LOC106462492, partial [Limulus polyphemus]|uniref:Uncharacterized protein LOC106462492 n=1 Tax=Limulus polyphemus TaxID=6850 RepID=A0ABM1BA33_LIMPO
MASATTGIAIDTTGFSTRAETASTMKAVAADTKDFLRNAETASTMKGFATDTTGFSSAETASTTTGGVVDTTGFSKSDKTFLTITDFLRSAETTSTTKVETPSTNTGFSTSAETVSTTKGITTDTTSLSTSAETASAMKFVAADTKGFLRSAETASTTKGIDTDTTKTASTTTGISTDTPGLSTSAETASTTTGIAVDTTDSPISSETSSTKAASATKGIAFETTPTDIRGKCPHGFCEDVALSTSFIVRDRIIQTADIEPESRSILKDLPRRTESPFITEDTLTEAAGILRSSDKSVSTTEEIRTNTTSAFWITETLPSSSEILSETTESSGTVASNSTTSEMLLESSSFSQITFTVPTLKEKFSGAMKIPMKIPGPTATKVFPVTKSSEISEITASPEATFKITRLPRMTSTTSTTMEDQETQDVSETLPTTRKSTFETMGFFEATEITDTPTGETFLETEITSTAEALTARKMFPEAKSSSEVPKSTTKTEVLPETKRLSEMTKTTSTAKEASSQTSTVREAFLEPIIFSDTLKTPTTARKLFHETSFTGVTETSSIISDVFPETPSFSKSTEIANTLSLAISPEITVKYLPGSSGISEVTFTKGELVKDKSYSDMLEVISRREIHPEPTFSSRITEKTTTNPEISRFFGMHEISTPSETSIQFPRTTEVVETLTTADIFSGSTSFSGIADTILSSEIAFPEATSISGITKTTKKTSFSGKPQTPYTTEVVGKSSSTLSGITETISPTKELFAEATRFSDLTETSSTTEIPSKFINFLIADPIIKLTNFSKSPKSSIDIEKIDIEHEGSSAISDVPKSTTEISTKEYIGDKTVEKVATPFPSTPLATEVEVKTSSSFSSPITSGELLVDIRTLSSFDRSVIDEGLEKSLAIPPMSNFSMASREEISLFTSSSVSDKIPEKIKNASLLARIIFTPNPESPKVTSTKPSHEKFDPKSEEIQTIFSSSPLSSDFVDTIPPVELKIVTTDTKTSFSTSTPKSSINISCSTLSTCASELQNLLMRTVGNMKNNYIIVVVLNNSAIYGNVIAGGVNTISQYIPSNSNLKEVLILNNIKNITAVDAQAKKKNNKESFSETKKQRKSGFYEKNVDSGVETNVIKSTSDNKTIIVKKGTSENKFKVDGKYIQGVTHKPKNISLFPRVMIIDYDSKSTSFIEGDRKIGFVEEDVSSTTISSIDHIEFAPKSVSGIEESIKLVTTENNRSYTNSFLSTPYIDHNKTELGDSVELAKKITKENAESENNLNVWNKIKDFFGDSLIIDIKPKYKQNNHINTTSTMHLDVDSTTISSGSFIPGIAKSFTPDRTFEVGSDFLSERDLGDKLSAASSSEPSISLLRKSDTTQNDSLWIGSGFESSGDLWVGSGAESSDELWTGSELSEFSVGIGREPIDTFWTRNEITKIPYSPPSPYKSWSEKTFDIGNLNTTEFKDLINGTKIFQVTDLLRMETYGKDKPEDTIVMNLHSTTHSVSETEPPQKFSSPDRTFVANYSTLDLNTKVVPLLGFDVPIFRRDEDSVNVTGESLLSDDFTLETSREGMDNLTLSSISSETTWTISESKKHIFTPNATKMTTGSNEWAVTSKPIIKTKIKQNISRDPASLKMMHETTTYGKENLKFGKMMIKETTKSTSERMLSTADQRKPLTPSFKGNLTLKYYTGVRKTNVTHVPITRMADKRTLGVSRSSSTETPKSSLQRFCTSIQHCNASQKERCVSKGTHSVCECGSAFARNPETSVCQEKIPVMASLKFPNEEFITGLDNPTSVVHQRKKRDAEQTMWSVVQLSDSLQKLVAHVIIDGFSAGSVVLNIQMILAGLHEDMSPEELEKFVGQELEDVLSNKIHLLQGALLNLENAILLRINPCQYEELNYCSKNADCLPDKSKAGGFQCVCREKYTDNSPDDDYPGEVCIAICPKDFCRNNGHCRVGSDDNFYCSCAEWYVGWRCEIPGQAIIGGVAAIAVVLLVVLIVVLVYAVR